MEHNRRNAPASSYQANISIITKICVGLLVLIIMFSLIFIVSSLSKKTEAVTVTKSVADINIKKDQAEDLYISPKFPVDLSSIRFSLNNHELDFDFSLSSWTAYIINFSNEHKTLELTLYNTNVSSYPDADGSQTITNNNSDTSDNTNQKDADSQTNNVNAPAQVITYTTNGLKLIGDLLKAGVTLNYYHHNKDTILNINFPYSVHLVKSRIMKGHPSSLFLNFKRTMNPQIVNTNPDGKDLNGKNKLFIDYQDDPEAIYDIAKNLLSFKKYDEAIHQLESNPMVTLEDEKAATMLIKLYIIKKKYQKSQKLAIRSMGMFPYYIEVRRLLAQTYFITGKYEQAETTLQEISPPVKENTEYYTLLASVLLKVQKYDNASGIYRKLLSIKPDVADWWAGLGITLQAQGKQNLALEAYARSLRLNDMDPNLLGYVKSQISVLQ